MDKSKIINSVEVKKEEGIVSIRNGGNTKVIRLDDIVYITAFGDYSYVHTKSEEKVIARKLLKLWERELPENFLRIHRGTIINKNYLEKIEKHSKYTYRARVVHAKEDLFLSARFHAKLRNII